MVVEILIIIGVAVLIALNVWLLVRKPTRDQSGELLLQQLSDFRRDVDYKLGESTKTMHESVKMQLSESTKIVKEVTEGLTKLDQTNKQVISFADQLQHLQDILQNPKQRGELGEYYLEAVLKDVFPPGRFQMQYEFKNGTKVDAALFLQDKIVPIDSKFSLENYKRILEAREQSERERFEKAFKRDLKERIDETSKYVLPQEGTMDFAFMFIPSEAIYYDLLANKVGSMKTSTRDLIEYAFEKKVIIVSPTSFLAYLQTVMQGLKSLEIESQAKEIQKRVGDLGRHLGKYTDSMGKLGKSLGTTVNHYNTATKEFSKIDKDVVRISGVSPKLTENIDTLERPTLSEYGVSHH